MLANSTGLISREDEYVRMLLSKQVDGLIIGGLSTNGDVTRLSEVSTPIVVLDRHSPGAPVSTVAVDNRGGAFAATQHLLSHGHPHVTCIGGPQHHWSVVDRKVGWEQAHRVAGIKPRIADWVEAPFGREGGYYTARRLLQRPQRPSAILSPPMNKR